MATARDRIESLARIPRLLNRIVPWLSLGAAFLWIATHREDVSAVVAMMFFLIAGKQLDREQTIGPMAREIRRLRKLVEQGGARSEHAASAP